jgi:pimeloyl-ACP methyl ester carboxylesterase
LKEVFSLLYDVLQEDGPFTGILGFSQGATVAAAFLMNHAKLYPYDLPSGLFQYAVFFAGAAPFRADGSGQRMSFEGEDCGTGRIRIPTVHIAGEKDTVFQGSLDMYKLCIPETALFIRHGGGHVIPRERGMVERIAKAIWEADKQTQMRS